MGTEASAAIAEERPALLEQEHAYSMRKFMGSAALFLLAGSGIGAGAGAIEGAFTPTEIQLGPHRATAQLTLDNQITFGLGPLGYANRQSPMPLDAGFKINIKEIASPQNVPAIKSARVAIKQYEELFADPVHVKEVAQHTVQTRIWHDTIGGIVVGGTLGAAGFAASRRKKEHEFAAMQQKARGIWDMDLALGAKQRWINDLMPTPHPARRRALLGLGLILITTTSADTAQQIYHQDLTAIDHVLDSTPAQGFEVHGELLRLAVDELAPGIFNYVDNTRHYYDLETKAFTTMFDKTFSPGSIDHTKTLWVQGQSDPHCNIGMDKFHKAVGLRFNADLTLNTGDITWDGNAVEQECMTSLADAITPHNPLVVVMGNHDSPAIAEIAKNHHVIVLDDTKLKKVAGFLLLGSSDVNASTFGTPMHLRAAETVTDEAKKIMEAACKLHPDIVMVHEPEEGLPTAEAGCAPETRVGHTHVLQEPTIVNKFTGSIIMNPGTSGGAKKDTPTFGPLQIPATETMCGYGKDTHRLIGCYVITASPDGVVNISDFQPTPVSPLFITKKPALAAK